MPCWGAYHSSCIAVGAPFTTRRNDNAGLVFPNVEFWPNFVCEVCTVRSVLGRELTSPGDRQLLVLERIRMIDIACSWSSNTHKGLTNRTIDLVPLAIQKYFILPNNRCH